MSLGTKTRTAPWAGLLAGLVALAIVLMASGSATAGRQATASRGSGSPIVAKTDDGRIRSVISGTTSEGGRVSGTFTPLRFVENEDGELAVEGVIDGVIKGAGGGKETFSVVRTLTVENVSTPGGQSLATGGKGMPGAAAAGSCDILNLDLGPLDLDLLGLTVHLNQVVLDIVAESGAGNLLGNLLCAVAGLLDPASPLEGLVTQLVDLLNQILDALNLGL